MFIRQVDVTTRSDVSKIVSCSEFSEQEIFQMLQDGKARILFDDQLESPPYSHVCELVTYRRLAGVYSGQEYGEKNTHTRETTYSVCE